MKKILYVSFDGMTDALGQSQVIPYMIGLTKLGYDVTILSLEKRNKLKEHGEEIKDLLFQEKIKWEYHTFSTKPPLLAKFYDLYVMKQKAAGLFKKNKFNIVHCRSYTATMVGMHLKNKYAVKLIFDMRGFWANERVDGGLWNLKNPIYSKIYAGLKNFEKKAICNADAIICLTKAGIREMETWSYVDNTIKSKIHHITTCCNINGYEQSFTNRKKRVFEEANMNFIYIGSIGPWHSYEQLTLFIKTVYFNFPGSTFKLIINSGVELIKNFITENKISESRIIIKTVAHSQIPAELNDTDIAFFFIPIQYSKIASSPTKMGEMLSAGLPIITGDKIGDVTALIEDNNIGVVLKEYSEIEIISAVQNIINLNKTEKNELMNRCLATAEDYFSIEKGIKKYAEIYESI
jgi:glycosyltransferase involved in cell wall biosynthesis